MEVTHFEFIVGRRGSRILNVNGCRYTKNRVNSNKTKVDIYRRSKIKQSNTHFIFYFSRFTGYAVVK